ncbi:ATP-binding protein [Elioraea sp.]|uniref:ATP-binding protein n=1 Tax=Elioraea sp. TaxID=2185103 RepID=UPI0025BB1D66|nr:ATP-binding protein [Elioraea sp.]
MPPRPHWATLSARLPPGRALLSKASRAALNPTLLVAVLAVVVALAMGGLALRAHVVEAARHTLEIQVALAAETVAVRLVGRGRDGLAAESFGDLLPGLDLGQGGAIALFAEDGTLLARLPAAPVPDPEAYGLPDAYGVTGIIAAEAGGAMPARLLAWRLLPDHGLLVVASRETAVVLLPWTRGIRAVIGALVIMLLVAGAYGTAAARARARALASDAALSLSEARAALVADALDVAIWFRPTPGGITRFFGDSVQRLTGYDRPFLETRPGMWADVVQHPEDRPALRAARAAADAADARGEKPSDHHATLRIVRADGAVRWVHSRTRRLGNGASVGVLHDVTALTLAQAALARREEELAEVLRIARIGALRLPPSSEVVEPSPELVVQWALPQGTRLLSAARFAAMLTPETRGGTLDAFAAVRRTGEAADLEFAVRIGDGSIRQVWARARREAGSEAGRDEGAIVAACQDVTERRAAEHALAKAQQMTALGHLTGGVAHDFNNLLTVVLLNLERIADTALPGSVAAAAVDPAIRAAETAARLTAQLLAFAGRQRLQPASVDPAELLAGLQPMLARVLGPRIAIDCTVAPGTPPVHADPTQLRTALLNLASNAREAMDGAGRLAITVSQEQPGRVAFAVQDEGVGMTPEVAARAFEPFFTTKPAGQGTGLGLSQAYGFVAQSRGEIAIESAPGRGTTVRFVLPAAIGAGSPPRVQAQHAHPVGEVCGCDMTGIDVNVYSSTNFRL